mmetsp:Transcript_49884/g.106143  ORF Transcript_49884/g.106143 Transcript_49884/m.106143 type:complete len:100 (-) Transcript_49884:351-650(-)
MVAVGCLVLAIGVRTKGRTGLSDRESFLVGAWQVGRASGAGARGRAGRREESMCGLLDGEEEGTEDKTRKKQKDEGVKAQCREQLSSFCQSQNKKDGMR